MAMWEPVRLEDLFEDDDRGGEPTSVGELSPVEIAAILRAADALEQSVPRVAESGIELVDDAKWADVDAPPVALPPPPGLPTGLGADLDGGEPTILASILPIRPPSNTADDEIARVLDFDWDACAPSTPAIAEHEAFDLVAPRSVVPVPMATPTPITRAGRAGAAQFVLAFAAAAVFAFALLVPIFACLLAWKR
jgi:hypothetical protein